MFIFRRLDPEFGSINTSLGDFYSVVLKERNKERFFECVKLWDNETVNSMYGVVVFDNNNNSMMPLYKGGEYYIMTDTGKMFERLSE